MNAMLFLFGALLIGLASRLLIHAIVLPKIRLHAHLRTLESYGVTTSQSARGVLSREAINAAVQRLSEHLGRLAMRKAPSLAPLKRGELQAAAYYETSPEVVHGYRVIAAVALPTLFILFFLATGGFSMIAMLMIAGSAFAGWQLPAIAIRRRGRQRMEKVDRDTPDLIDLLTATVEAGMGVAGSLGLVADRFSGPLGDELRLMLKQQSLGISHKAALEDMLERCDTPSVRAFVRTVSRGESLGVSIAPILRELAIDVRRRRRQFAREKMQKAPVKMLFPIMFLIFPSLMIVLMFPAAYSLLHSFTGM